MKRSAYFSDEDNSLYYSYETCDNPDIFMGVNMSSLAANMSSLPANDNTVSDTWYLVGDFLALLISVVTADWYLFHKRKNMPIGPDLEAQIQKLQHERASSDDGGSRLSASHEVRVPIELSPRTINVMDKIGSGAFGVVSKARYTPKTQSENGSLNQLTFGIPVAVKTLIDDANAEAREEFAREAVISAQFVHCNVVGLIGVVTKSDPCMLVLQYCSNGALDKLVATTDPAVDMLVAYCIDIAAGMSHLAAFKFVHRDLACRNVLVDDENNAKIAE